MGSVPTNADIVRTVTDALGRGDLLAVMGLVGRDVRWAVNAADREAAPWFRVYQGKRSLPDFFAELSQEVARPDVARDVTKLVKVNDDYQQAEARLAELLVEWERAETFSSSWKR